MTSGPRDENHIPALIAQSNATRVPVVLYADPTTHRLLVDSNVGTGVINAEAVNAADFGQIFLGSDGSNYRVVTTDADGNLQVDIVSGGGGGVQYTEGDTDASITGTALMWEDAANTLKTVSSSTPLPVTFTGGGDASAANQVTIIGHLDGVETLLGTIDTDTGAIATSVASIDTKTPALGQALAAASVPVILPAATITTLTPPAAITGFGTAANQTTIIGHLDGVETLLGTIDADTSALVLKDFATQTTLAAINAKLVTGTVIGDVNLGATDNAVLDAIAASVAAIDTDATTIIGHVDGLEALIGTTNTNTGATTTALQIMDDWDNTASDGASVSGDVAHDSVDAGEPVKIGGQARTTNPTAVADADRVNAIFDKIGRQVVTESIRDLKGVQQTTITSSTTETTVVTAVASTFLDVYGVVATNTSATVTKVTFKDSTTGTTRFVIEVPATDTRGFMLPVSAAVPQAAVNNNWTATCGTSVASVEITMLYIKNI